MPVVATALERAAPRRRAGQLAAIRRALWRRLLVALDRFVPPQVVYRHAELPVEWFKYPPI